MSDEEFDALVSENSESQWFCARCLSIKANKISWGILETETQINEMIKNIYDEVLNWRYNIFPVPRGKSGIELVKEMDRLINLFVRKTGWKRQALSLLHIFLPIMYKSQVPNPDQGSMLSI